ncbi:MAG: PPC domain-containing protein, partial [Bacteroidota bacterium]
IVHLDNIPTDPFEDKEYVAADNLASSPFKDNVYVSWTQFSAAGTRILISRKSPADTKFSTPMQISDVGSVQGSVPAVGPGGVVYVTWFDFNEGGRIMIDKSVDGGANFGPDVKVTSVTQIGQVINLGGDVRFRLKGSIRVNSFPSIAVDKSGGPRHGSIYVVWADQRLGDPDIYFSRSVNEGLAWSTPTRINDDQIGNGKDQWFPWVTVDVTGDVHVVYYDSRNDPQNLITDVYIASSSDGSSSWTNKRVSSQSFDPQDPTFGGTFMGDYNGIAWTNTGPVAMWTDGRRGQEDIVVNVPASGAALSLTNPLMAYNLPTNSISSKRIGIANVGTTNLTYDVSAEQTFGLPYNTSLGGARMRGNVYKVSTSVSLQKIKQYFMFTSPTKLYFFVYEAKENDSLGNFAQVYYDSVVTGTGVGFYSSPNISGVNLQAGKFYFIGAAWSASIVYYYDGSGNGNYRTRFGRLVYGGSVNTFPPPAAQAMTGSNVGVTSYQALVTSAAPATFLSFDKTSGVLSAGNSDSITVTANSTGLAPGIYSANLLVSTNDAAQSSVNVLVALGVETGEPNDVASLATLITYGDSLTASLGVRDVDYYKINAQAGDIIDVWTRNTSLFGLGLSGFLKAFDASGNLVAEDDDFLSSSASRVFYRVPSSGTYYIRFADRLHPQILFLRLVQRPRSARIFIGLKIRSGQRRPLLQ